jgi:hypothetical protein
MGKMKKPNEIIVALVAFLVAGHRSKSGGVGGVPP